MEFKTKAERDKFIEDNMKLVTYTIDKKFPSYKYEMIDSSFEETFQTGCIGLIKAVDKFDENKGYSFSTYAISCIVGEILLSIREIKHGIRYGRRILTNKKRIEEYLNYMAVDEVAEKLKLSKEEVLKINELSLSPKYINQSISSDEDEPDISNSITEMQIEIDYDERLRVNDMLNTLSEKNKAMVIDYVFNGMSQRQIGEKFNCTQQVAGKNIKRSFNKLREIA